MTHWLTLWRRRARRTQALRAHLGRPQARPALEALEDRRLLNGNPILPNLPPTFLSPSTVPANGDLNPYGVAFVPKGFPQGGPLSAGDIVVSNFNNSNNLQGTGITIVDISPTGKQTLFFQGSSTPGALGLTTALGVLKRGFVIVGSLPTLDGSSATIQAPGSLLILNSQGTVVTTLSSAALLDGPWDLTIHDQGEVAQVFVSNVLSGTVTRIDLKIPKHGNPVVESETQIASGYFIRTDPAALVIGPTGLAYDADHDILYVASTGDNAIFAISHAKIRTTDAGMGSLVYQDNAHLRGPLALTLTPNGDLITSNGDAINPDPTQPSELVEFTTKGQFVAERSVDSSSGAAFGLALEASPDQIHFAAVDDALNTLDIWTINLKGDSPRQESFSVPKTTAAPETTNEPASLHAATVDRVFTTVAEAKQSLSFANHTVSAPQNWRTPRLGCFWGRIDNSLRAQAAIFSAFTELKDSCPLSVTSCPEGTSL
jgi:hypothetical protein